MSTPNLAWAALAISALLFGGCSSMQSSEEAPVGDATGAGGAGGAGGTAGARGTKWSGGALDDPSSPLYKRVVYFEYDSVELVPESRDVLRAHGSYLSSNRNTSITIEGHCDERGSREYNLALGERRAQTVKRYLEAEGVSSGQLAIISYGEERPANTGHSESAWAENRRGVLAY
jgi:peptidoglycan-associated lipoprotein